MLRLLFAVLSFCLIAYSSTPARGKEEAAEPPEQARELFKEGRRLIAAGEYSAAAARLEESIAIDDGMGTRFHLASCYEKLGKLASAHAQYLDVAARAAEAGQVEREQAARERAAAVEPRLSRLRIDVMADEAELELARNGVAVPREEWNQDLPVDPGRYEIGATAPGKKSFSARADVPEGPALVVITVPELESREPRATPVAAQPAEPPEAAPAPATSEPGEAKRGLRTAAYVIGGVGLAALLAGTTFALQYQTSYNDARAVCRGGVDCTQQEIALHDSLVDDSKRSAALSYVGFGVGAVAALGATLLFVSSQRERPPGSRVLRAVPVVAQDGSWGAAMSGSF